MIKFQTLVINITETSCNYLSNDRENNNNDNNNKENYLNTMTIKKNNLNIYDKPMINIVLV